VFSKANVDDPGHVPAALVPSLITQAFGKGITPSELEQVQKKAEAKATKSGIDLLDFIELARELMSYTTHWGILQTRLDSYVGFDTIQDQMKKKSLKRGFEFNLMVVGKWAIVLSRCIYQYYSLSILLWCIEGIYLSIY
jgi:septin 3/9/12